MTALRAARIFRTHAREIADGYTRRKTTSAKLRTKATSAKIPPWDTANGYLKCELYRLGRHFIAEEQTATIRAAVEATGRVPSGVSFDDNPFHWVTLAVEREGRFKLERATRRLIGNELTLAFKHDVPTVYLIGFIYQLGNTRENAHERSVRPGLSLMYQQLGPL